MTSASVSFVNVAPLCLPAESDRSSSPSSSESNGVKRRFDRSTVDALEAMYAKKRKMTRADRKSLSEATNLSDRQIGQWFTNRRRRRGKKESTTSEVLEETSAGDGDAPETPQNSESPTAITTASGETAQPTENVPVPLNEIAFAAMFLNFLTFLAENFNSGTAIPNFSAPEEAPTALTEFFSNSAPDTQEVNVVAPPEASESSSSSNSCTDLPDYLELLPQLQSSDPIASPRTSNRVPFTPAQKNGLREAFVENEYPSRQERGELATKLGLANKQVEKWFENRRHYRSKTEKPSLESAASDTQEDNVVEPPEAAESSAEASSSSSSCTDPTDYLELLSQLQTPALIASPRSSKRVSYTPAQKKDLCEAFLENQYPNQQERGELAIKLGLEKGQVSRWFQNRRHARNKAVKSESAEV